jgi:hypothetical protein
MASRAREKSELTMNRNTKRKAAELAKARAADRRADRKFVNPPSKRRRQWRGAPPVQRVTSTTVAFRS